MSKLFYLKQAFLYFDSIRYLFLHQNKLPAQQMALYIDFGSLAHSLKCLCVSSFPLTHLCTCTHPLAPSCAHMCMSSCVLACSLFPAGLSYALFLTHVHMVPRSCAQCLAFSHFFMRTLSCTHCFSCVLSCFFLLFHFFLLSCPCLFLFKLAHSLLWSLALSCSFAHASLIFIGSLWLVKSPN